ncbi:cyclohexanone monooxygenase [Xylariales sp. PMI_506]|nr:cyclohexanone monooxygenase [Xylariales sp. PMI_506]
MAFLEQSSPHRDPYVVSESPLGTPRHLRVAMVGAGASGLNMARHMELHMQNYTLTVYDKNTDVGGTWLENRYPGCACDIPSHNYQFTWEPNPNWSHYYSPGSEILEYFQRIAKKYELYKYIKFRHAVTRATWVEDDGIWNLEISNLDTGETIQDTCHVLINGGGVLNKWKWPDIAGIHSFSGDLVHTATWTSSDIVRGKTVAVVGSGSSGVQIIPSIQPDVKQLIACIRSPTWITPGFAQNHAGPGGTNFAFSEEQRREFRENPDIYNQYRKKIEGELNARFKFIIVDSEEQKMVRDLTTKAMQSKIKDEKLADHLIPKDFAVGCRRACPGPGFLEALGRENVRVVMDKIQQVVPKGVQLVTGESIEVDTIVCATGFDLSFCPQFELIGRNGEALADRWRDNAEAYLGLGVSGFPNYFVFLGPNSPVGHGSILPIIEHVSKYVINMLKKMQTQNIKSLSPLPAAVADFSEHVHEFMKRTAWATPCRSWFKNGTSDGPVVAVHPGGRIHWFHMLQKARLEDWEYTYLTANRFQYLGNGFSTKEAPGLDTTWYFDEPEMGYDLY